MHTVLINHAHTRTHTKKNTKKWDLLPQSAKNLAWVDWHWEIYITLHIWPT